MINLLIINNDINNRTTKIHFYNMFDYLTKNENFHTIPFSEINGKSEQELSNLFIEKFNKLPDNIIFFEHLTEMSQINIPKEIKINVIIDDLHHQGIIKKNRIIGLKKVSRILSTYGYCFAKYYSTAIPVYFFPHASTFDSIINDYPINKILVSGRLNKEIYPFRHFMYEISKYNQNIEYLPVNCGYTISHNQNDHQYDLLYGQKYVDKLNKYLACFTCDASIDRPYIVAKHFEILSSGALLLAGNPNSKLYFEKLGFIDGVHYISANMENIISKISYILDPSNLSNINKIRKNGYDLVRDKHFYKNRGDYLINILEDKDQYIQKDGITGSVYYLDNNTLI